MDRLLEVTNIKNEWADSTSSDRLQIPTVMQSNSVKQESDCLPQSATYIKTETQESEREAPLIENNSYEMCAYNNIKFTTIKIKCEGSEEDIIQDSLDVGDDSEEEKHLQIDLEAEPENKIKPTDEEKCLKTDKGDSNGSASNKGQDQLLIKNRVCKDKKYICKECNKMFGWKSHLDKHLRIHTGEKPYTCDICEKSFNQKGNLDYHMFIHNGNKPYICDVCKKMFVRKTHLDSHKLIHSGEKPLSCNECNKSFALKQHLVEHKRIHTGIKPFSCDLCVKSFARKSHLTQHRYLHTGEKLYSCDICEKSFSRKSTLNRHKKTH